MHILPHHNMRCTLQDHQLAYAQHCISLTLQAVSSDQETFGQLISALLKLGQGLPDFTS